MRPPYVPPPYVPPPLEPPGAGGQNRKRRNFDGYNAVDSDRNAAIVDEAHVRLNTATQSSNSIPPSPPIFRPPPSLFVSHRDPQLPSKRSLNSDSDRERRGLTCYSPADIPPPYVPPPPEPREPPGAGGQNRKRREFDGYDAVDSDRNTVIVDEAHVRHDTATQSSNSIPPSPPIFRGEYTPYYIQVDDVILNDDAIFNDDMRAPSEDVSENLLDPISPSAPSIQAPSFSSSEHPNHPARAFMPPLQRAETDRRHEIHSRDYGAGHPECRGCDGVCGHGPCVHCVSSWGLWGITNFYPPSR